MKTYQIYEDDIPVTEEHHCFEDTLIEWLEKEAISEAFRYRVVSRDIDGDKMSFLKNEIMKRVDFERAFCYDEDFISG